MPQLDFIERNPPRGIPSDLYRRTPYHCLKRDICVTSNILLIDKMLQYQWDVNLVHKAWLCNSVTAPSSEVVSLTGFNKLTHKLTK